jgi:hypothetical protein
MIHEDSDWVSEISATGLIRHQRQHHEAVMQKLHREFGA